MRRRAAWGFAGTMTACALIGAGCNNMQEWDWFGLKKPADSGRPATSARKPANQPVAAGAEPVKQDGDPQSKELDERVERYVRSMNADYDPAYQQNDFSSKIRRQNDPERSDRIRRTAARSRSEYPPLEPEFAADDTGHGATPASADRPTGSAIDPPPSEPAPDLVAIKHEAQPVDPIRSEPAANNRDPQSQANQPANPESTPIDGDIESAGHVVPEANTKTAPEPTYGATTAAEPDVKPPVLEEMKIDPAPEPKSAEPKQEVAENPGETRTAANTPTIEPPPPIDTFKSRLEDQQALVAKDPNNLEEQLRLRMMYLIAGQDDKALASSDGINADVQEIMRGQIRTLMGARSTSLRDPAAWANQQLDAIEDLRSLVRAKADLIVPKVELCTAIEGFGRYEPIQPAEFVAGAKNRVLIYIEVDNFQTEKTASGLHRTLLSVRQSLLNTAGEELWSARDENIEDLARQMRRDFYLTIGPLSIPKTLGPGSYLLKVEVEDVLAGKLNSNVANFKMLP